MPSACECVVYYLAGQKKIQKMDTSLEHCTFDNENVSPTLGKIPPKKQVQHPPRSTSTLEEALVAGESTSDTPPGETSSPRLAVLRWLRLLRDAFFCAREGDAFYQRQHVSVPFKIFFSLLQFCDTGNNIHRSTRSTKRIAMGRSTPATTVWPLNENWW